MTKKNLQIKDISIYNSPILVLQYFFKYLLVGARQIPNVLWRYKSVAFAILALGGLLQLLVLIEGPHAAVLPIVRREALWYGWWLILGIASSIGLGTGLHTFVLFLGPFIAETTTAAYKCHSFDFAIRGPSAFTCRYSKSTALITVWSILSRVRWEAFSWGVGTAIGELPPYFVARAASLAGNDDESVNELEQLRSKPAKERTLFERGKLFMFSLMEKLGFFGILVCASIPNPLFDLAGIICGSFGISFPVFFGATLLGKAVVKTSLQSLFVIALFSEETMNTFLFLLQRYWPQRYPAVKAFLDMQLEKFSSSSTSDDSSANGLLSLGNLWSLFVGIMILYFLLSIIESLALVQLRNETKSASNTKRKSYKTKRN